MPTEMLWMFAALHSLMPMPHSRTRLNIMCWLAQGVREGLINTDEFGQMERADQMERQGK